METTSDKAGFLDGARAVLGGARFIVTKPANWPLAAVPVGVLFALGSALGGLGLWLVAHEAQQLFQGGSAWMAVGRWVFRVLASLVALLVAFLVGVSLAQPLSGVALETLARRQEAALGGRAWPEAPFLPSFWRGLRVNLTGLALGTPLLAALLVVGLLVPVAAVVTVPLKFLVSSVLVGWDLIDYPLSVRGWRVRDRWRWIRAHRWPFLGFGMACAALLLIPGLGLLLLPVGAAGATRLVHRTDPAPG
ncbi:MAG: EI24 domain-containing protein [Deltaproteobacteria bacterium]|nr:EI24 domain-containing protein [Deltaproteobacteria bacterium]